MPYSYTCVQTLCCPSITQPILSIDLCFSEVHKTLYGYGCLYPVGKKDLTIHRYAAGFSLCQYNSYNTVCSTKFIPCVL